MRPLSLLCFALSLPIVLALPAADNQIPLGTLNPYSDLAGNVFNQITSAVQHFLNDAEAVVSSGKKSAIKWLENGKEFVLQNGLVYELVTHPLFANYQLRFTKPKLCDTSVKQYSGYLDIADDKHLFFWFFESRFEPEEAPLVLWLNGGPGCSSSTGLLFELGPCSISNQGLNTTYNPFSWTNTANIIFLDQPVNVGFSYADDGTTVSTSPVVGRDVYAFLELFLDRFPEYADRGFHLAAESYGGVYGPNIASVIWKENKQFEAAATAPVPGIRKINLESLVLANGLTDPYVQMGAVADYACDGPYPVYDDPDGPECASLRQKEPTCQRLIKNCYDFNSRLTCVPAGLYCNTQLYGPLMQLGLNPYDVRKKCDRSKDGDLCYKQMSWIESWMNLPETKAALGVDPDREFRSCNMDVNRGFMLQGDGMHNSAMLLPELVNEGVRLLVYAGNADMMCNFIGNERWVEQLDTVFLEEFTNAESIPWVTLGSGRIAGEVRSAGGGGFSAGNVTFVNVHEAGHMVPYDQPEAALDLFVRWVANIPLSFVEGV